MENTEEVKQAYTLFWSGEEISADYLSKYYENELDNIKEENLLLGNFNAKGKYFFAPETKKALIAIKKAVEEKIDNSYYLIAKTIKHSFAFKMKVFEVEDETLLAANLYLIEVVDDERFKKPIKTFVAQYVDNKDEQFINKAKYIFNISIDGDFLDYEKQENEKIIAPVLPKEQLKNIAMLELAAENYVKEILAALETSGEIGKEILKEFEIKSFVNEGEKPFTFIELKKKLDAIIEKKKSLQLLAQTNQAIALAIKKYNEAVENEKIFTKNAELSYDEVKKIDEESKKEEKKEEKKETKKPSASKGGGGKSGGGGKKGGGKKKDKGGGKKGGGGKGGKKDKKDEPSWKNAPAFDLKKFAFDNFKPSKPEKAPVKEEKKAPTPKIKNQTPVMPAPAPFKPKEIKKEGQNSSVFDDVFSKNISIQINDAKKEGDYVFGEKKTQPVILPKEEPVYEELNFVGKAEIIEKIKNEKKTGKIEFDR